MTVEVDTLWISPLKGSHGQRVVKLTVDTVVGVKNDRRCGVRRHRTDLTKWAPKAMFYVCMNTPQMVLEQPFYSLHDGVFELDPKYIRELHEKLGAVEPLDIQTTDDSYSLHDTPGGFVSFVNLESVRELGKFMGLTQIDAARFRMNAWLKGLAPFEELTWIGKTIQVGDQKFLVDDACIRCKAPEANPKTGQYDLLIRNALQEMMGARGYVAPSRDTSCVMGILARPLHNGEIRVRGRVKVL